MNSQSGIGRVARRLVVGLTRAGVSVRGARELLVADKESGAPLHALVFPVSVDGVEYLVSTRPDVRWVKSLRKARSGELRLGRHRHTFRATLVDDADATRFVRAYQRRVPSLVSREPVTGSRAVVFRVDSKQS